MSETTTGKSVNYTTDSLKNAMQRVAMSNMW